MVAQTEDRNTTENRDRKR